MFGKHLLKKNHYDIICHGKYNIFILAKRRIVFVMNKKNAEEKVKLSRIALIDEIIRSGKYPNSEELAAELEVSPRTILRDIDYLKYSYDAPIEYDFNKRGFYYTEPNFFIRSVMLSKDELETVTTFDQLTKMTTSEDDDFSVKFRKIIDKLLMVLPKEKINSLPFSPTPKYSHDFEFNPSILLDGDVFGEINNAIRDKKVIEIEYWISDNRKYEKILIEPLYYFFENQFYYLLAWKNNEHKKPGIYSMSRINKVKNTGKNFEIPGDFKVTDYIKSEKEVSPTDNKLYHFELSFPKEIAKEAIDKTYYPNQHIKICDDGTAYVSFKSTELYSVYYWVLSEGHRVKVLNPPELVNLIKMEVKKLAKYYL
jgi:predicted DNA-binding transcriptional regulator YafY